MAPQRSVLVVDDDCDNRESLAELAYLIKPVAADRLLRVIDSLLSPVASC